MNRDNLLVASAVILIILILIIVTVNYNKQDMSKIPNSNKTLDNQPPPLTIDINQTYSAVLKTSEGEISLSLDVKQTPVTVNNFVYLAKKGFYNNTIFHRVIKDFMIQGGDPKGDGTGGPGYKFNDEAFKGEYTRGVVAMANSGPNTNGSQFFIVHKDSPLPKNYVIFGKVVESTLGVVDKIAETPVKKNADGELSQPINPVKIELVKIIED